MKYAIITPTYKEHFKYIGKYLASFSKYVTDKEQVEIIFTISEKENSEFEKILKKYRDINYRVVFFEDLLKKYNINYTPEELLKKYRKYSFQTLKKFYTMLDSDADYFFVLDSESMWINKTSMSELFKQFFDKPFICASILPKYKKNDDFKQGVIDNINYILGCNCDKWFLENFVWFYDKHILQDLFNKYGTPIEIVDKVYNLKNFQKIESGVFEIELYLVYLYQNIEKYNYSFVKAETILNDSLSVKEANLYRKNYNLNFNGNCGLLEHIMLFLTKSNYRPLAEAFKQYRFNIIRCDYTNLDMYKHQKAFLKILQPSILAASQDHGFGLNNPFWAFLKHSKCLNFIKMAYCRILGSIVYLIKIFKYSHL